jgi:hypothetical protein
MLGEIGRLFLILGVILAVIGATLLMADKIPYIGRLPGDIIVHKKNFTFYFPLATGLLISLIASLVLMLLKRR